MSEITGVNDVAERAFQRHYRQIYRFVRRRTACDADAEDIAQDVFAAAAAALDGFKPGAPPVLAWLYTVAQRRLADEARRTARRPAAVVALGAVRAREVTYGPSVAHALKAAIAALPPAQREVVVLKLLDGRSFAEIAERLGTTEGATKMRLARGLERLRDELEKEGLAP